MMLVIGFRSHLLAVTAPELDVATLASLRSSRSSRSPRGNFPDRFWVKAKDTLWKYLPEAEIQQIKKDGCHVWWAVVLLVLYVWFIKLCVTCHLDMSMKYV